MKKQLLVKSMKGMTNYTQLCGNYLINHFKDPYFKNRDSMESKAVLFWGGSILSQSWLWFSFASMAALEAWRHVAEKDNLTSSDLAEVGLSYHPPTLKKPSEHTSKHPRESVWIFKRFEFETWK